jgi:uncharacterized protein HemX
MPARKKSAPKRRSSGRRSPSSGWLLAILVLSLTGLGGSLWLLHQERAKNRSDEKSLTEKALKMAGEHPNAEVFQLEPGEKKK